jgi:hypothetical protein
MAAAPQFKVYAPGRGYVASCKYVEDAAAIVSLHGAGTTIRFAHRQILWHEGHEAFEASESYDRVAQVVYQRLRDLEQIGQEG